MYWIVISVDSRQIVIERREEGQLLGILEIDKRHVPCVEPGDVLRIEVDEEKSKAHKHEVGELAWGCVGNRD